MCIKRITQLVLHFWQKCCTLWWMKLVYVADGRSPIALNWIDYFIRTGHEVHLVSTFPCRAIEGLTSLVVVPVALSDMYGQAHNGAVTKQKTLRRLVPVHLRTLVRQLVAPLSFPRAAKALWEVIERIHPDIVHAMRIPYEGMTASIAMKPSAEGTENIRRPPLLISVWGNDFTLHAKATPIISHYTKQALESAGGLHTDCQRDQRLALELGFDAKKPKIVLPGGGGVQLDTFYPPKMEVVGGGIQHMEDNRSITVINPRGFRAYVRNDTFFKTIPLVIERFPKVHFICPGMKSEVQAEKWSRELGIGEKVDLLPAQSRQQMAELFRQSQITVSITTHDGTPNSLLEAMACGSFPIVGDIEPLHEWIMQGDNGLLVDPSDPKSLADAIMTAISQPELRRQAGERNIQLIRERAEYDKVMQAAEEFYGRLINN
jgi:glycosyltransferase involved in cell wall biosynthesis